MFEEGQIIYFDPFYFKNGNVAKAKYLLVLKQVEKEMIIASLPSSKDYVPAYTERDSGCIELPDANFNCFVISPKEEVTLDKKHFEVRTHLYGHLLDQYSVSELQELYPNEGTDYVIWGKMKEELFTQITECFKNSKSVKRKYRRLL